MILQFHRNVCENIEYVNLALKSNLAPPMIVLVFEGSVFAVVNPVEGTNNIQVCPNHLQQMTSCTLYTVYIFYYVLYKSEDFPMAKWKYENISNLLFFRITISICSISIMTKQIWTKSLVMMKIWNKKINKETKKQPEEDV